MFSAEARRQVFLGNVVGQMLGDVSSKGPDVAGTILHTTYVIYIYIYTQYI